MKLTWEKAEKWFNFDHQEEVFINRKDPDTHFQAWEKTICKWVLIAEHGYDGARHSYTCGLCFLYLISNSDNYCEICPISKYAEHDGCAETPWSSKPNNKRDEHELMFLLSLYEAERQGFKWE